MPPEAATDWLYGTPTDADGSDVGLRVIVGAAIERRYVRHTVSEGESVSVHCISREKLPLTVGVPEINPCGVIANPVGSVPIRMVKARGKTELVAPSWTVYGWPATPNGRSVGVNIFRPGVSLFWLRSARSRVERHIK